MANAARAVARLTQSIVRSETTGVGTGLGSTGLGLMTPVKPMFPKDRGASGACAAVGAANADGAVTAEGPEALTSVSVTAEAGRAKEATMAPEMTITAEAFVAGLAEREIADDRDDVELSWLGARWRPE